MIEIIAVTGIFGLTLMAVHRLRVLQKNVHNSIKGWTGEKKVALKIWASLDSSIYHRMHDLIIPSKSGTTQIDHLIVSRYGLFVVETKHRVGWIFGSEDQPKWTQSIYGKKYTFQNPVRQAYRQKKVLSEFLGLRESSIHPVICFVGDCKFKTKMPSNVIRRGLGSYVKQFKDESISSQEVDRILRELRRSVSENKISKRDHIRSLKNRHGSDTICPRCGSMLVRRVAKNGKNSGKEFLGCSSFPWCRFVKNT